MSRSSSNVKNVALKPESNQQRTSGQELRIRRQTSIGDVTGVCQRPPDEEEEVDEAFFRQLEKPSQSQALGLMGGFNHLSICWKGTTAGTNDPGDCQNVLTISDTGDQSTDQRRCSLGPATGKQGRKNE